MYVCSLYVLLMRACIDVCMHVCIDLTCQITFVLLGARVVTDYIVAALNPVRG